MVHLDQGFISVLNDDMNGIPDITGCHPCATPQGVFYSGPDQSLLESEMVIPIGHSVAPPVAAAVASRKSIGGAIDKGAGVTTAVTLEALQPAMRQILQRGGVIGSGEPRDAYSYPTNQLGTFHSPVMCEAYSKEAVSARLARKLYYIVVGNPIKTRTRYAHDRVGRHVVMI